MISAVTLSVQLALHVAANWLKKRKNLFSVDSQNLLYTIFCESKVLARALLPIHVYKITCCEVLSCYLKSKLIASLLKAVWSCMSGSYS